MLGTPNVRFAEHQTIGMMHDSKFSVIENIGDAMNVGTMFVSAGLVFRLQTLSPWYYQGNAISRFKRRPISTDHTHPTKRQ